MALITLTDLEPAVGKDLTGDEAATYAIELVSMYIRVYTDTSFEEVTETITYKADYYGRVQLNTPVTEVSGVVYYNDQPVFDWQWDGWGEVYGIKPNHTVKVTYTHGFTDVPNDVKYVAIEAAKRLYVTPDRYNLGMLMQFNVGDVSEWYNSRMNNPMLAQGLFNDLEKLTLDNYRETNTTLRLGYHQPDNPESLPPDSESAIFE